MKLLKTLLNDFVGNEYAVDGCHRGRTVPVGPVGKYNHGRLTLGEVCGIGVEAAVVACMENFQRKTFVPVGEEPQPVISVGFVSEYYRCGCVCE